MATVLVVGEVIADLVAGDVVSGDVVSGDVVAGNVVSGNVVSGDRDSSDPAIGAGDGALAVMARPGGSPANVAVGLARLGVPVELACRLSGRGLGPWLREHLRVNGVGSIYAIEASDLPTLAFVGLDPAGVPTYGFYGADTADWQWQVDELPTVGVPEIAAVHTGSLATALPPGAALIAGWVDRMRAAGDLLISYDPNVRPSLIAHASSFVEGVEAWVGRSNVVKVSEEDLAALYPGRPALDVAARWVARGPEVVILTCGADDVVALRGDGTLVKRPGRRIDVVDTVGAGDALMAGLLAGFADAGALMPGGPAGLSTDDLGVVIEHAVKVAALTCTRAGADPPSAAEVAAAGP